MSIEQPTPLARAIAIRNFSEQQRTQKRLAELTGSQYQPVNPLIQEAMLLGNTRMIDKVLAEPTAIPSTPQALIANVYENLGDDVFEGMVQDLQKDEPDPLPITGAQLRSLSRVTTESAVTAMVPTSIMEGGFERMMRQVNVVRELSAERHIEPTTVYEDDGLYSELIRRSQTPREVARLAIDMTKQFTPDKMSEMIMNIVPAVAQTMDEAFGDEPLMDRDEIQEMRQEMAEDPEFQKMVRTATLQLKRAMRILTGEQIVRFWGQEVLDSLPKTVKRTLVGTSRNTSVSL